MKLQKNRLLYNLTTRKILCVNWIKSTMHIRDAIVFQYDTIAYTFLIITLLKRIRNKSDIQCVENISYKIYVKLYIIIYDVCIY